MGCKILDGKCNSKDTIKALEYIKLAKKYENSNFMNDKLFKLIICFVFFRYFIHLSSNKNKIIRNSAKEGLNLCEVLIKNNTKNP
jgi:hypothetical protein